MRPKNICSKMDPIRDHSSLKKLVPAHFESSVHTPFLHCCVLFVQIGQTSPVNVLQLKRIGRRGNIKDGLRKM